MKITLLLGISLVIGGMSSFAQNKTDFNDTFYLKPIEINAVRATDKTPIAKTNLSRKEIAAKNIGLDLPFILNQTPSVVVNADAGNGIGYTGIRIRGTDASRINITLNGIPYNDAESQGTFLVNIPDIASSAGSIQVQRGVGTSTNGAGSFGGSINLSTNEVITKQGLEFNSTAGSYHSFKNTLIFNSGIFKKNFSFDGRLSSIRSDGYIDRANTRLQSFYTSAAYVTDKNSLRLNVFSGKEKTYQAWYGIDENTLKINRTFNSAGTEKAGEPYSNETDNYTQTHYQLFYNQQLNQHWKGNIAFFLTKGAGYYEQYKADQLLSEYGLPDYDNGGNSITETDLVRRLWLDNDFYGSIFSLQYSTPKSQVIIGGGINQYDGKHFGEIISAEVQAAVPKNFRYYDNTAKKKDYAAYAKWTEKISKHWQTFLDLQVRAVDYSINGFKTNPGITVDQRYQFFNPKAGITWSDKNIQAYLSYGRAAKEPNRDDFENNAAQLAKPEKLNDFEAGLENKNSRWSWGINLYYMQYRDQLVLTGKINDVGAYTRSNIANSYRAGVELSAGIKIYTWLSASGNLTLSKNKVKDFTEYLDDYDNGGQQTKFYKNADIAFSPSVVSAYTINVLPLKNMEINLMGKYVGRQYLDNTSQKSRSLRDFYVQDIRLNYALRKTALAFFQVNNLFSKKYEPNGYTFSYVFGGEQTTENYYFPMAPINWVLGLNIKL
ncbi:MAG: TonB-dependent receptor [Gloeobacteraceae cyanobacterium ES-bin-316]|nr:TonB-dependent receptor [Ferruginibacter sp.]